MATHAAQRQPGAQIEPASQAQSAPQVHAGPQAQDDERSSVATVVVVEFELVFVSMVFMCRLRELGKERRQPYRPGRAAN